MMTEIILKDYKITQKEKESIVIMVVTIDVEYLYSQKIEISELALR